jgi:hypothetical protein
MEGARLFNNGYDVFQDAMSERKVRTGNVCSEAFAKVLLDELHEQNAVMNKDAKERNFDPLPIPAGDREKYAKWTLWQCVMLGSVSIDGPAEIVASPARTARICSTELRDYRYNEAIAGGADASTARGQATAYYQSRQAITDVENIQRRTTASR